MYPGLKKFTAGATAGNVVTSFTNDRSYPLEVLFGEVILTTDATVANRIVIVSIFDEADVSFQDTHAGLTVPANQANQHFQIMQGQFRETAFVNGSVQMPIPISLILPPAWTLRVSITAGVAGDSYTSKFLARESRV